MNSNATEHVQDMDKPSQVLRKILQHFNTYELLTLSRVNKIWNFEARSLMRERGNLVAHLQPKDENCEHLEIFASDLRAMNVVPFSGVSIKVGTGWRPHQACQPSSTTFPDQSVILDRLPCTQFSFQSSRRVNRHCKSFLLAKEIFKQSGGRLEQLTISISDELDKVIGKIVQESYFSRLKILKLEDEAFESDQDYIDFVKTIISHAPNLQELHSVAPLSLLAKVLEGSSVRLMYSPWITFDQIPEVVIGAIRLENLKLRYTYEDFSVEQFNSIVPRLLQTSCTNLKSMELDAVLAVSLMFYGIPLRNVTELCININFRQLQRNEPPFFSLIKDFDFTRIFPSLRQVSVGCLEDEYVFMRDD